MNEDKALIKLEELLKEKFKSHYVSNHKIPSTKLTNKTVKEGLNIADTTKFI